MDILEGIPAFLFWGYFIYVIGWQSFLLVVFEFFYAGVVIFFFLFMIQMAYE